MRNNFRVIDADGHMAEPKTLWDEYVEPAYYDRRPIVVGDVAHMLHRYGPCELFPNGDNSLRADSHGDGIAERFGEGYATWWTPASRLKAMDSEGIDVMVTFRTNGKVATAEQLTDPDLQAALCRAYNNWAIDYCSECAGRVKVVGLISLLDPAQAVAEVRRLKDKPEVVGIAMPPMNGDTLLNSPDLDPLWKALSDYGLPVCFHGGNSQRTWFMPWTRGGLASTSHAISFPTDALLAMGCMMEGLILERYPDLRAGFFEANAGWVPWWLGRLTEHLGGGRQTKFRETSSALSPAELFERQCWVASDVDEATLGQVTEALNGKNLLYNSDYPHGDSPFPGSVDYLLGRDIPDLYKQLILWDNAVAFFGDRLGHR